MKKSAYLLLVLFSIFFLGQIKEAVAAPYYQGKIITITVGHPVGGGYDRLARVLAKHLPKYIPGKPSIVVQNMPGAGTMVATNYFYNVAKPNGLSILNFERGLVLVQLLKVEGVKFDLRRFAWIGSLAKEATILVLRSDLPYKDFNDVLKAKSPIMYGRTGTSDTTAQLAFLLQEFAGLKLTFITYPGSAEILLAIERKEVDALGGSYSALKPHIDRGLIRPFIRSSVSEPEIDNLPVDKDMSKDPKGKTIMALRSSAEQIGRPYVCAPGTPAPVMKILREAFAKVVADPEMLEDVKRIKMRIEYSNDQQCLEVVNFVMNQPESMVKEFGKYIKF